MAFSFWQRPNSPEIAAALLVSRIIATIGAAALFYLAYRIYYIPDPRFSPGVTQGLLDNPNFILSAFILVPTALVVLLSMARTATSWTVAILIVCVALLEGFAASYRALTPATASGVVQTFEGSVESTDCGKLGACLARNSHAHAVGKIGEKVVYDAVYNVDESGVRKSLPPDDHRPRRTFVGVFGDSNTFGMNVSDELTLSGQIGQIGCSTHPYNFAVPGGDTAVMLAEFEENLVSRAVRQSSGYFIYVYNETHMSRNVGDDGSLLFGKNFPAYDFDSDGSVSYKGTLWTDRPVRNALMALAQRSNVIQALNIRFLEAETDHQRKLTAALIDRTAQLSREQFPNSKFVLLLAPQTTSGQRVAKQLRDKGVQVLDLSSLIPASRTDMLMFDRHPTPAFHREMANQIVRDLGLETSCSGPG